MIPPALLILQHLLCCATSLSAGLRLCLATCRFACQLQLWSVHIWLVGVWQVD